MKRTKFEASRDKFAELHRSEAAGEVADSLDVRKALIQRMTAGELTLDQVQAELKRIRRGAAKAGKVTRTAAFRRG